MDDIKNVIITESVVSNYIHPRRMHYEQSGQKKTWDFSIGYDGVNIIIFNVSRQVLLFVKQFRPGIYYSCIPKEEREGSIDVSKYPPSLGITLEICGGLIDKDKSAVEIAREEVLEECGYSVPLSAFQRVTSYMSSVSMKSSQYTLYYVEVTDSMKVNDGGGVPEEGEQIEVVEMTLPQAYSLIFDESVPRPVYLVTSLLWFFHKKCPPSFKF